MSELMLGAEPFASGGGQTGVLLLHGFGGSTCSVRPVAVALAAAGYSVSAPLLPGHGTTVDDMIQTSWDDWSAAADQALRDLAAHCQHIIVVGLSMGGTLALGLASQHPELAGIVTINAPITTDPELVEQVEAFVEMGASVTESVGHDIALPGVLDVGYDETPLVPLLSSFVGRQTVFDNLGTLDMPALVIASRQDHSVDPGEADVIASRLQGQPQRLWLEKSYHVATLDYDQDLLIKAVSTFVAETSSAH